MSEHKLIAMLSANGILAGLSQAAVWLDPVLRIILLLGQIGVALVTIAWIIHKIKKDK